MGANRKPRKAYRPRPVDMDPMDLASSRAALLQPHQKAALVGPVTAALDHLRRCVDPWTAWCSLADAFNVAEQLALRNIVNDKLPEFHAAQQVMHDVYHRHADRGTWALRATELGDAIQAVQRRVAQALAGNAPKSARVCVGQIGNRNPETNQPNAPQALEAA